MKRTRIYIGFLTGWFLLAGQQAPAGEHFVTPVNPGASAPFATWATAGTNLAEVATAALADATTPRVVWVSNGVYALSATITLNKPLTIRNWPGNEGVVVDGQDTVRCFYLDDTGAELDGLTLTRGSAGDGGAVFMAKGGLVQNCTIYSNATTAVALGYYNKYTSVATDSVIRNCRIFHNTGNQGGGIRMSDYRAAVIEHCRIYSNTATTASGAAGGGGVCLGKLCVVDGCTIFSNTSARDGGGIYAYFDSNTVVNCMIEGNTAANLGGGVALHSNNRGLISNCVIRANRAGFAGGAHASVTTRVIDCLISSNVSTVTSGNEGGGGLYLQGAALADRCAIQGNLASNLAGGLQLSGGTARNCLITGNRAMNRGGGVGLQVSNKALVENCTITGNTSAPGIDGGGFFVNNGSTGTNFMRNCILYGNFTPSGNYSNYCHYYGVNIGSYSNCVLAPALSGKALTISAANRVADPRFVNADGGDHRLLGQSPAVNAGATAAWMSLALDFAGQPRLDRESGIVDIGCHEYHRRATLFMIR